MSFHYFAGHAFRTLTARKDGPSLYDVCDPVLAYPSTGDPHLAKFYKTALGNPALRALLRRAGLPDLRDEARLTRLREALTRARDHAAPDWEAVGRPVADLLDTIALDHPKPPPTPFNGTAPALAQIDDAIRDCAHHLLRSYGQNGFLPTYAAFNLIGDPDFRGRELIMALTGLNSRGYKNSSLLFNLARVFIARSGARAIINPPWRGIAEPIWEPVQIRHRSAYYDAFFIEALLAYRETGLASPADATTAQASTARASTSSRPWRRRRIRASRASLRRSSRTWVSASTCLIATPPPARSPQRRRPAQTIRSSTSRCSTSTPAIRCARVSTSRASPCRSTTTSITKAGLRPGSTIWPASGRTATISTRR